jgi:hypothetical protein
MARSARRAGPLCVALLWPLQAWPAHPLQTEDTATQGVGNVEFENGLMRSSGEGQSATAYSPQLSYGLWPTVDLIVQPSWMRMRDPDGVTVSGVGDTRLDLKWRFYGSAPLSLAVRAGIAAPSSQPGLGLRRGTLAAHAALVVTYDEQPFTVHGNLGYSRIPGDAGQRSDLRHVSSALMWAPDEHLTLTLEVSADSNPDRAGKHWLATALAGLIYTLRPGLDIDVGYQASMLGTPPDRAWLIGLTWRFAL